MKKILTVLFALLSLIPALFHALALGWVMRDLVGRERMEPGQANALFVFLGLTTFAVAVAFGEDHPGLHIGRLADTGL